MTITLIQKEGIETEYELVTNRTLKSLIEGCKKELGKDVVKSVEFVEWLIINNYAQQISN